MEPRFLADVYRAVSSACEEANGSAATPNDRENLLAVLEPGLNLLLVKVLEKTGHHKFRFRFCYDDPPVYSPVTGEAIRIHVTPDLDEPGPALFLRMDTNKDGLVNLFEATGCLISSRPEVAEPLPCSAPCPAQDPGAGALSQSRNSPCWRKCSASSQAARRKRIGVCPYGRTFRGNGGRRASETLTIRSWGLSSSTG